MLGWFMSTVSFLAWKLVTASRHKLWVCAYALTPSEHEFFCSLPVPLYRFVVIHPTPLQFFAS